VLVRGQADFVEAFKAKKEVFIKYKTLHKRERKNSFIGSGVSILIASELVKRKLSSTSS
jgi:hypothetical protein